jgi:hypothetical protein
MVAGRSTLNKAVRVKAKQKQKRVSAVADIHAGSDCALTTTPGNPTQRGLLERWRDTISDFGEKPDLLVCNGDACEGQDRKTLDVAEMNIPWQIEQAAELLLMWKPKEVVIIQGTAYHTGDTVAHEAFLAKLIAKAGVPCTFHRKLRARVNGWFKFQARHFIGHSALPYGIFTSPARSQTGQVLNAAIEARDAGKTPDWPQLSMFAHAHVYGFAESAQGAVVRLPCWKATGDAYGDLKCDGHIDLGAFQFTVGADKKEGWSWERKLYPARLESRTVDL